MFDATLALHMPTNKKGPPPDELAAISAHSFYFAESSRLRKVWDAKKRELGPKLSQKAMALEWGVNASLITQYLNGHIKLNTEAKLRFAGYLKMPVVEIWPDFELAHVAPGDLSHDAIVLATMWSSLPLSSRKAVSQLISSLASQETKN